MFSPFIANFSALLFFTWGAKTVWSKGFPILSMWATSDLLILFFCIILSKAKKTTTGTDRKEGERMKCLAYAFCTLKSRHVRLTLNWNSRCFRNFLKDIFYMKEFFFLILFSYQDSTAKVQFSFVWIWKFLPSWLYYTLWSFRNCNSFTGNFIPFK